jgi:uncharacterized protein YodC (DUF2158 family)
MSYKLADGSCSTDYKRGDEFTIPEGGSLFLEESSGVGDECTWFRNKDTGKSYVFDWEDLTPVKTKKNTALINQLHETIRQLKATIKELER